MALRVMLYSQDSYGLGHLRRSRAIADALVASYPEAEILMLADSPLAATFPTPPDHRLVTLPLLVREGPNRWRTGYPSVPLGAVLARRQELMEAAILSFSPDLMLVDHLPVGALGELRPLLTRLKEHGATLVLGLRDVLDDPAVVRRQWREDGSFEALNELYDRVLVYGEQRLFDIGASYGFSPGAQERLRYCGYLGSPAPVTRHANGSADGPLAMAVAGGGADAYPMLSATLDAVAALPRSECWRLTLVTGPFLPEPLRREVRRRADGLGGQVVASVGNLPDLLATADVIVARAGYNTVVEALRSRKPTVLVPRPGPSREQRLRSERFREEGWVEAVEPGGAGHGRLSAAISRARTDSGNRPAGGPDLGGLDAAINQLVAAVR